jgi:hypothetical protein
VVVARHALSGMAGIQAITSINTWVCVEAGCVLGGGGQVQGTAAPLPHTNCLWQLLQTRNRHLRRAETHAVHTPGKQIQLRPQLTVGAGCVDRHHCCHLHCQQVLLLLLLAGLRRQQGMLLPHFLP